MFIINQDKKTVFNINKTNFLKIYSQRQCHQIIAQTGYTVAQGINLSHKPIIEVLGEYETEEDAQYAFDKIIAGIQGGAKIIKMPPHRIEEEEL